MEKKTKKQNTTIQKPDYSMY